MNKGYQIIEPACLGELMTLNGSVDVAVALLSWLVEILRIDLEDRLNGAQIELIRAEYHGAYPAIGVHYPRTDAEDLGPVVETTIAELTGRRSIADFAAFLARVRMDWRKVADDLMGAREKPTA